MFLLVSVILSTGGSPCKETLQEGGTPLQGDPPWREAPPSRETPDKEAPPSKEAPWQGDPPGRRPLARRPPRRPPQQGDPPGRRHPPAGRPPGKEALPPWKEAPPAGRLPWEGGNPLAGRPPPPRHTVNEQPVRILLECVLVATFFALSSVYYCTFTITLGRFARVKYGFYNSNYYES